MTVGWAAQWCRGFVSHAGDRYAIHQRLCESEFAREGDPRCRCDLDTKQGRASFHSFRTTFQSLNDDAGTSRVHIRGILGHVSTSMSDTYSRLEVERARKSVAAALPLVG